MKNTEHFGIILALLSAALWGLFPVMVNQGTKSIPPITFAALSTLLAAIGVLFFALRQKNLKQLKNKAAWRPMLMVTLSVVIIPYILFFIGASKTSGVNASLLLLAEIIFTLIFTPLIGEKTTPLKLLGAGGVFAGGLLILYNGTLAFNLGDLIIILSTVTYPLGNFYAKKALNLVSPTIILLTRFFLGGLVILFFALAIERPAGLGRIIIDHWFLLLFNGLILLGLNKIIWYESLKRLDISKAISLGLTSPLFSLAVLIFVVGEKISFYQWGGLLIMMAGVYFSAKRKSVDPQTTKYAL